MQRLILATAITVFLAPVALAQSTSTTGTTGSGAEASVADTAATAPDLTRASRVLRQNVYNPNGDAVGSIDELIIDPHSGQIQQVVIGVGGFLGIGDKPVAVPFSQLAVKPVAVPVAPITAVPTEGPAVPPFAIAPAPGGTAAAPAGTSQTGATRSEQHFVIDMTKDQLKAAPEYRYPEHR
jgi:sporulation protein YlmC with PRC-barrel domain